MKIMAQVLRGLQNGIGRDKRMLVLARILLFMNEEGQAPTLCVCVCIKTKISIYINKGKKKIYNRVLSHSKNLGRFLPDG